MNCFLFAEKELQFYIFKLNLRDLIVKRGFYWAACGKARLKNGGPGLCSKKDKMAD